MRVYLGGGEAQRVKDHTVVIHRSLHCAVCNRVQEGGLRVSKVHPTQAHTVPPENYERAFCNSVIFVFSTTSQNEFPPNQ